MKTCSVCQRCYEDSVAGCVENHGTLVAESAGTREMIPNYRLDSLLERDAVGESYLATNIALDQPVVVKIIAQNLIIGAGEKARQMLQSEARTAANFDHPNIARVHESGWLDGGAFYIVTESVGDKTLQGFLRNTGALSESEAVKIARQTAQALITAHAAGIIHRAVSPANIILTRNEQNQLAVKLQNFDFGGIKQQAAAGKFAADTNIETLRYLSPEQFNGKSVDAQTDIYSLGIVLYEMLCGRSPFNAPTSTAIADRQIDEAPLAQLRFDVRALLTHTIKESLQKRPAARLQTGNFARQLRHIAQLILPLGENLPAAPQVLLPNNVTTAAPELTEPTIEEQSPHEVVTLDKIDTIAVSETAEQPNIVKAEENAADEGISLGELAPVFIMKDETEADLPAEEAVAAENEDAKIDSFAPNPVQVEQKQVDNVQFESDVEQNDEIAADEMPPFGELAPVFVMKNEPDVDISSAESSSFENADTNFDSPESNSIVYENPIDASPLNSNTAQPDEIAADEMPPLGELAPVFLEKNQVDETPLEAEPMTAESRTIDTASTEPEVFVFPEENIKHTPAAETAAPVFINYPDENRLPRRPLPLNRSALVGAGLLAVLVSVMLGLLLYNRMQNSTASEQATAAAPPVTQKSSDPINDKNETAEAIQPDTPETKNSAPIAVEKTPLTASKRPEQKLPPETTAANPAVKQNEPVQEQAAREKPAATDGKPRTELNSALDDWISATNSRNVDQQMNYYAPKLNAYYLTRNTSQGAVRAEKKRVFSRADAVDIQTGKPDISLSPDGQKATMRFRKKYAIKQGQQYQNGEVIQELQWVKSDDGWRIVSERDVKVINR